MKIYEVITRGIPECDGISYVSYQIEFDAIVKLEEIESQLKIEDKAYGWDYFLIIKEKELK